MQGTFYYHRPAGHQASRFGGRGFGGGKRVVKSFNPFLLIQNNKETQREEPTLALHQFTDFQISDELQRSILQKGYTTPTPIQDQAIPHILAGRDLIGIAHTGTGKTAAFLIPLINKVQKDRQEKVLILSPTRELASQTQDEFYDFSQTLGIYSVLCIGGVNISPQRNGLRRPHNFVIGTPGRIKDLVRERSLQLANFHTVVLDEADHMVDIGFIADVKYLVSLLSPNRQSLFFSATINGRVREILQGFVRNYWNT